MWLILLLSLTVSAAEKKCDKAVLQQACASLNSKTDLEYLQLSNGFKWQNPMFARPTMLEVVAENRIQWQLDVMNVLEEIKKTNKLSDKFVMAYLPVATHIAQEKEVDLYIPVPFDSETAPIKKINSFQLLKMMEQFPAEHRAKLIDLAKKQKDFKENAFARSATKEDMQTVVKNKARVEKILNDAKASVIEYIAQGKSDKNQTPEQKNLIEKIKLVEIKHGDDPDVIGSYECAGDKISADYNPNHHKISVCRSLYGYPDSSLTFVIGHELGHIVDPCRGKLPLYVDKSQKPPRYYYDRKNTGVVAIAGLDKNSYPFNQIRQCLVDNVGVREFTKNDIAAIAMMHSRFQQGKLGLSESERKIEEDNIKKEILADLDCIKPTYINAEVNESFSDVFGSVALSAHLKNNPIKTEDDRVAALAFPLIDYCEPGTREPTPDEVLSSPYMGSGGRLRKILLNTPEVAQGFSCRRDPKYMCSEKYFTSTANTSKTKGSK